jgi:hypothetical protein
MEKILLIYLMKLLTNKLFFTTKYEFLFQMTQKILLFN